MGVSLAVRPPSHLLESQPDLASENYTILRQPCLFTMLKKQAKANPKNIAVRDSQTSVDYAAFQGTVYQNALLINQLID
ncbi:hypothetical protein [Endozoicomonas sp. ALE010]|uniref:hypothetical protein n=1 Tax=Endozoicomonas sp. ALE010 TaxID=3403081 RepID=UPI003BB60C52